MIEYRYEEIVLIFVFFLLKTDTIGLFISRHHIIFFRVYFRACDL